MEDSDTKYDLNCGERAPEVSKEDFSILPRNHSHNFLVKMWLGFARVQNSLPKSNVKSFGLILLATEISKQPSIDCCVVISFNSDKDL